MNILGLITEYNPLHNGHIYHLNEAKKLVNPDLTICVMSSSFTQRGEISIIDKFTKAKEATLIGIDLVIELPFVYTVQNSDIFAEKAIEILNLCNCNTIVIGSEENNINIYKDAYNKFNDINNQLKIKEYLDNGYSYKKATSNIINLKSNDLLGYSYYKAIKDNNYNIELKTIKRIGSDYLDNNLTSTYSSAKAIRCNLDSFNLYTPKFSFLDNYNFLKDEVLYDYIRYRLLTDEVSALSDIFLIDEGIENLFKKNINLNYNEFINKVTNKRYTLSRIKRSLLYILFNIKKDLMKDILNSNINYIRVLGMSKNGLNYLNKLKKNINIYTNIKEGINKELDIELKVSKLLDIIYNIDLIKKEQCMPYIKE